MAALMEAHQQLLLQHQALLARQGLDGPGAVGAGVGASEAGTKSAPSRTPLRFYVPTCTPAQSFEQFEEQVRVWSTVCGHSYPLPRCQC